jgi:hypothetical protein
LAPSRYVNYHTLDAGVCGDHGGGGRKPWAQLDIVFHSLEDRPRWAIIHTHTRGIYDLWQERARICIICPLHVCFLVFTLPSKKKKVWFRVWTILFCNFHLSDSVR